MVILTNGNDHWKTSYSNKQNSPARRLCPTHRPARAPRRTCRAILTAHLFHSRFHFHQQLNITLKTLTILKLSFGYCIWYFLLSIYSVTLMIFELSCFHTFTCLHFSPHFVICFFYCKQFVCVWILYYVRLPRNNSSRFQPGSLFILMVAFSLVSLLNAIRWRVDNRNVWQISFHNTAERNINYFVLKTIGLGYLIPGVRYRVKVKNHFNVILAHASWLEISSWEHELFCWSKWAFAVRRSYVYVERAILEADQIVSIYWN